jgi:CheY-like chemotaxis protein
MIDLTMPNMNGIECLQLVHTILPALPAVLSSGFAEDQITARFGETGFSVFLQKPFSFEQFANAIRQAAARPAG